MFSANFWWRYKCEILLFISAICWSPALFSETIKKEGELISQAYSILATASETGHIVLWKIKLPLYGE